MLEALLLGRRSNVSGHVEAEMKKAGTYHVLAISGLHVGIVVLLLTTLLSILRLGRIMRIAVAVACVLGYVIFTGARPSAQRAWTFFMLVSICRLLQWKIDYPDCVCAVGAILLLAFPSLAWDVGFKLSLGAVFGITLLVPQLGGAGKVRTSPGARLKHYLLTGLVASFSAQVFTLPVLLYHFGRVSLIGPVSNLVVLPVVTLIVAAGMEALLAVPCWMGLAEVFMRGASTLVWLLFRLTGLLTGFVDPLVFAGRPATWKLVVYCGILAYVTLVRSDLNGKLRLLILLLLCAFLIVSSGRPSEGGLVVTFLYVGDGDACFIEMPNGTTLLIDAGACSRDFDAGRAYVLPFLAMKGVKRIDSAIITHSHNDHYGGLLSLMESVRVEQILIGASEGEAGYTGLLSEAGLRGIDVRAVGRGDTLHYGETRIEVLHPPRHARWAAGVDPNAQSVVCKLTYRNLSVLFTGDVTPLVQSALAGSGVNLSCDILKVPHHGAPGGVDSAFAAAVGARCAVVSVGSRFASHPCPATIDLLARQGMRVLTTVSDGAVTIGSDGHSWRLRSELGGLAAPVGTNGVL
jgi:competence protein ComEC